MNLAIVFGLVDGAAAAYLLAWARRREKRDKPAVMIVGLVLVVCSLVLLAGGLRASLAPPKRPMPPTPSVAPSTVGV